VWESWYSSGVADSSYPCQIEILSDQSFPAILPTTGERHCLQIFLLGYIILIFTPFYLANIDIQAKVRNLLDTSDAICKATGKELLSIFCHQFCWEAVTMPV
jgi:hypothetical protein